MRELLPGLGIADASSVARRVRVLRHRTLRWFQPPIHAVIRERPGPVAVRDARSRDEN